MNFIGIGILKENKILALYLFNKVLIFYWATKYKKLTYQYINTEAYDYNINETGWYKPNYFIGITINK